MSAHTSIVFVTGKDRFQVIDTFTAERDGLSVQVDDTTGVDTFGGDDPDVVAKALDAARTPAMFGGRRLVVLSDAISEETLPLLQRYADDPADDVTLLLMHVESGRASKAYNEFVKTVAARGSVVKTEAPPSKDRDLPGFVNQLAKQHALKMRGDACSYLAAQVGADTGTIIGVIDQLVVARPGATIEVADVAEFVSGTGTAKTWDLTDAIDAGDRARALLKLHALLDTEGMHALQVQTALVAHVRKLMRACEIEPRSQADVEASLGVKGYPAKKLFDKARTLDPRAAAAAHREVTRADVALRGGTGLDDRTVLEVLVARLCNQLGTRTQRRRGVQS